MAKTKPVTIRGSHPSQPRPAQNPAEGKVHAAIFPRAFEEGRQLGGKVVGRPDDLRGHSLSQEHAVGYATNAGTTPSQQQAQVKRTAKIGPKQAARPAAPAHKGGPPKTAVRKSGRTAPAISPPQPVGRHRS